jgi:hypothetical protein
MGYFDRTRLPEPEYVISKPLTLSCGCGDPTKHELGSPHPVAYSALLVEVSPENEDGHRLFFAFPPLPKISEG